MTENLLRAFNGTEFFILTAQQAHRRAEKRRLMVLYLDAQENANLGKYGDLSGIYDEKQVKICFFYFSLRGKYLI